MGQFSKHMFISCLWMLEECYTTKQSTDQYDFRFLTCLKANMICQDLHSKKLIKSFWFLDMMSDHTMEIDQAILKPIN